MKDKTIAILENRVGEQMANLIRKYGGTPFSASALAEIPDIDPAHIRSRAYHRGFGKTFPGSQDTRAVATGNPVALSGDANGYRRRQKHDHRVSSANGSGDSLPEAEDFVRLSFGILRAANFSRTSRCDHQKYITLTMPSAKHLYRLLHVQGLDTVTLLSPKSGPRYGEPSHKKSSGCESFPLVQSIPGSSPRLSHIH